MRETGERQTGERQTGERRVSVCVYSICVLSWLFTKVDSWPCRVCVSHLSDGALLHGVLSHLSVDVQQSEQEASATVQEFIREVRVTED